MRPVPRDLDYKTENGRSLRERFWDHVSFPILDGCEFLPDDCWEWSASKNGGGYGRMHYTGNGAITSLAAHRIGYEIVIGSIPDGLYLDHLCRNPGCVNPYHLEPVTNRVNVMRGATGEFAARQECIWGHPKEGNLYQNPSGSKGCVVCLRASKQRYKERIRSERIKQNNL